MPAISAQNLTKTFTRTQKAPGVMGSLKALFKPVKEEVPAVKGVDLSVSEGELIGFLGPNGAGKTTTIKMLSGILHPTSGEASVLGYRPFDRNPEMLRQMSLVMGNKAQLWWDLPATDSFLVLKEIYDVSTTDYNERVDFLIESLDLKDKVSTQVRRLSLGERMKCELVAALLHRPRVLFLDEPTIGLDIISQTRIREFLKHINREEKCTIVLTSHYMQDVKELCERVVIIDHGTKVFDDTLNQLTARYSDIRRLKLHFSEEVAQDALAAYGTVISCEATEATIAIPRSDVATVTGRILNNLPIADISMEEVSLDEVIGDLFERKSGPNDSRETLG